LYQPLQISSSQWRQGINSKYMTVPPEISTLIDQLERELDQIGQEATAGVSLVRSLLSSFPDNIRLIQFFTAFNNRLLA
jgi:hypothetical protein